MSPLIGTTLELIIWNRKWNIFNTASLIVPYCVRTPSTSLWRVLWIYVKSLITQPTIRSCYFRKKSALTLISFFGTMKMLFIWQILSLAIVWKIKSLMMVTATSIVIQWLNHALGVHLIKSIVLERKSNKIFYVDFQGGHIVYNHPWSHMFDHHAWLFFGFKLRNISPYAISI